MIEALSIFDILSVIVTFLLIPVWYQISRVQKDTTKLREEHTPQFPRHWRRFRKALLRDSETTGKAITDLAERT